MTKLRRHICVGDPVTVFPAALGLEDVLLHRTGASDALQLLAVYHQVVFRSEFVSTSYQDQRAEFLRYLSQSRPTDAHADAGAGAGAGASDGAEVHSAGDEHCETQGPHHSDSPMFAVASQVQDQFHSEFSPYAVADDETWLEARERLIGVRRTTLALALTEPRKPWTPAPDAPPSTGPWSPDEVQAFEDKIGIPLPLGLRDVLLIVGASRAELKLAPLSPEKHFPWVSYANNQELTSAQDAVSPDLMAPDVTDAKALFEDSFGAVGLGWGGAGLGYSPSLFLVTTGIHRGEVWAMDDFEKAALFGDPSDDDGEPILVVSPGEFAYPTTAEAVKAKTTTLWDALYTRWKACSDGGISVTPIEVEDAVLWP